MDSALIVRLFARLQARYGHKWVSQFPTEALTELAIGEWATGLAGLTPQHVKHGLDTWAGDWPPSLPEFRRACLGVEAPETNDDWAALGRRLGCMPSPGEEWKGYVARVRRALQSASRPGGLLTRQAPALEAPVRRLADD